MSSVSTAANPLPRLHGVRLDLPLPSLTSTIYLQRSIGLTFEEPLEAVAKKHSASLSYCSVDVTDPSLVAKAFEAFVPKLRYPLRGLVACAGVSDNGPSVQFPATSFRRLMDINVLGTFVVAQAVAQEMQRTGNNGSMVLVASMSGTVTNKVS
jgi:NAD(P)-dependent dehydrogenase (short-subunit alcohol dehydrogenase family)